MNCICKYNKTCNKENAAPLCAKEDYESETGRRILSQDEREQLKKEHFNHTWGNIGEWQSD